MSSPTSSALNAPAEEADLTGMKALVDRARDLTAERKRLDDELELIRATIQDLMGDAQIGTIGGAPAITWKTHVRTSLDSTALKTALPDLWAQYATRSVVRRFEVLPA